MTGDDDATADAPDRSVDDRRRRALVYGGLAALAGTGTAGAWYVSRDDPAPPQEPDDGEPEETGAPDEVDHDGETAPSIVRRYAPDLYFGALEKWYPTDPRPYVVETAAGSVVDGFTALDGYAAAFREAGAPPAPTVFYNVVEAAEGVDALQYWLYSAFDQFAVNFHWHDWELLQVFVERETGEPLLLSASAHSRASPNNEFLEPEIPDGARPGILSEVGSHSSASEVNGLVPTFERFPTADLLSDVTNDVVDVSASLRAPFAYGLPRDEGARLPFVLPELDGVPLHEHPSLSIDRTDLIDERVTVGSWGGLPVPPGDLPLREPGLVLAHPESRLATGEGDGDAAADATYALEPIAPLREAIDDFVGPQLSFEFAVPGFAEDAIASHITSVGVPWEQDRFADPLSDVTDPAHRRRVDGAEPTGLTDRVVGRVRQLRAGTEGALDGVSDAARDAVAGVAGVSLFAPQTELAVRLASEDPTATATRGGAFGFLRVEPGPHLLVVNGPGFAPIAERFVHEGGLVRAGGDGELVAVATEDAGWIRGDGRETGGIDRIRVVEDYAGVIYEGAPAETDRFAVAVHREGKYTVEVVDRDGRLGAYRVTADSFDANGEAVREEVRTGKLALARTLRDEVAELYGLAESLSESARDDSDGEHDPALDRLSRARRAADGAVAAAEDGEEEPADDRLFDVGSALSEFRELLAGEDRSGYDDAAVAAMAPKALAGIERVDAAVDAPL
ncbi:hypothetical protein [Halorubrum sp. Ea8]|uniref:hypothetical protein n=1 Tax=Halorubrum sp. Ea8 TaxID=1383841 RepID=UPI000BD08B74|nr:hypothetical protein [Halorubrum sp. Ea8]OYR48653.1 hypothetical protein DJ74_10280 [Halorubrum sp. Ea8]